MPTDNRASKEVRVRKPTASLRIMEIREGTIGDRLVEPEGDGIQNLVANRPAGHGHGEEFPVRLCIQMTAVQWKSISLPYVVIPFGLHCVNASRDETNFGLFWWIQGFLIIAAWRWDSIMDSIQVEAKNRVRVQVVQSGP